MLAIKFMWSSVIKSKYTESLQAIKGKRRYKKNNKGKNEGLQHKDRADMGSEDEKEDQDKKPKGKQSLLYSSLFKAEKRLTTTITGQNSHKG
jgi:hypothetical protein